MPDRAFDRLHYMEAWLTGYNACREGVPNDFAAIMARVKTDHADSGAERARAVVEGHPMKSSDSWLACTAAGDQPALSRGQKREPEVER